MKRDYSILEFEIVDKEYITSSNRKFEKTVKVILNNNGVTEERQLAYIHFDSINWNTANNFDFEDCFIHEFSISKYKEKLNLEAHISRKSDGHTYLRFYGEDARWLLNNLHIKVDPEDGFRKHFTFDIESFRSGGLKPRWKKIKSIKRVIPAIFF